jgi:hypothetical protein
MGGRDAPAVTVVVATFNRSEVLASALASIREQELQDFEVRVVGDACTDDSEGVVRALRDARFHWTNLPSNSGSQAIPNNTGVEQARGRYVAYLGHDDLWLPWHLSSLVRELEGRACDMATALVAGFAPEGVVACWGPRAPDVPVDAYFTPPSGWMVRRVAALELGPWSEPARLAVAPDQEWLRRYLRSGRALGCTRELSVLKCPSTRFPGSYAFRSAEPQAGLLERIRRDARALERELLADALTLAAWSGSRARSPRLADWTRLSRRLVRSVWERLEGAPPPIGGLVRASFQWRRRRRRRLRGLRR